MSCPEVVAWVGTLGVLLMICLMLVMVLLFVKFGGR